MCLIFSKILGLPHGHIIPDAEPPKVSLFQQTSFANVDIMNLIPQQGEAATTRPRDCHLYTGETEILLDGFGGLEWTPFEDWWVGHLNNAQ